jgi:1,4-alpha-glucan branching enzyme
VEGVWTEILNSDATVYGGSGVGNLGAVETSAAPSHGRAWSLSLTLPPLAVVAFRAPRAAPPPAAAPTVLPPTER